VIPSIDSPVIDLTSSSPIKTTAPSIPIPSLNQRLGLTSQSSYLPSAGPPSLPSLPPLNYESLDVTNTYPDPYPFSTIAPSKLLKRRMSATPAATPPPNSKREKVDVLDLIDIDDKDDGGIREMIQSQQTQQKGETSKKRRIADFQCVICLGDPEDLSVTTCGKGYLLFGATRCAKIYNDANSSLLGHLFCNGCIKLTLSYGNPGARIGNCPVCRRRVKTKDVLPLELKLSTKKGKERAKEAT